MIEALASGLPVAARSFSWSIWRTRLACWAVSEPIVAPSALPCCEVGSSSCWRASVFLISSFTVAKLVSSSL